MSSSATYGKEFSTAGDAFSAAFSRAGDAIEAALAAQRSLSEEVWPEAAPIRVRMGLHTGEAQERGGDYFGTAVNRAARVMSIACGGQILVSSSSERVLGDRQDQRRSTRSLGEVQLRGLGRAEEIFELQAPGLEHDFPPLVSPSARRGRLPRVSGDLVGREEQVGAALGLLDLTALVTLVGPGGVGKTRLSVEVASELFDQLHDGVWFVELAPVSGGSGVASAVAEVVGVQETARQTLTESIVGALAGRAMLLVLDNCEHVLAASRDLATAVGDGCPGVKILATSREPLAVRGERVLPVPTLALGNADDSLRDAPAVRLFVDLMIAADPNAITDNPALSVIGDIYRDLDGMPLALELAAARVRGLGIEDLASRLDERFRRLRTRGGTTDRHQTLRATVAWSYDLLDDSLRTLFCRASVFAGAFTLDSAEEFLQGDGLDAIDVADGLADLVDKSMIQTIETERGRRYRLLESMRQFGMGEAKADLTDVRERLVRYHTEWAEHANRQLYGPEPSHWFPAIADELDNLRESFHIANSTGDTRSAARLVRATAMFSIIYIVAEPKLWRLS